jgi:hypothetical protein
MTPVEILIPIVAIIAVFGTGWFIFNGIFKLVRLKMERKYSDSTKDNKELKAFMERTEQRLRALEQIVTDDDSDEFGVYIEEPEKKQKNKSPDEETKSRLKNQLKS